MNKFLTTDEKREQSIKRAAIAGARMSRYCRNAWTGEQTRICLERAKIQFSKHLIWVSTLGNKPLIAYSNCAGLDHFYLGRPDQHRWDADRWEMEIRTLVR